MDLKLSAFASILDEPTTSEFKFMEMGETIRLKVGETKYFKIHENPTTGYTMIENRSVDGGLYTSISRYEPRIDLSRYINIQGTGGLRLFEVTGKRHGTSKF